MPVGVIGVVIPVNYSVLDDVTLLASQRRHQRDESPVLDLGQGSFVVGLGLAVCKTFRRPNRRGFYSSVLL